MASDRSQGTPLQFGSTRPTLFSTGCADPLDYVGAPIPRRARVSISASSSRVSSNSSPAATNRPVSSNNNVVREKSPVYYGPPVRDGMCNDGMGAVNLDNMDVTRKFNPKFPHLTSPRSIAVCRRMGITPRDLLVVTYEDSIQRMQQNGEQTSDPEVVRRRYEYWCLRRDQKLHAARTERASLMTSPTAPPSSTDASKPAATSVVAMERQLQKIMDANSSRLKQQLLHQEVLHRQREKEEQNRAAQRKHDEEQIEKQRRLEREKARKEEEAQRLRAEMKELQKIESNGLVEERRRKYEETDNILRERIEQHRLEMEAKNEAKRQRNAERRAAMRQQAESYAAHRREIFEQRWKMFQQSQAAFEHHRAETRELHAIEADRKRERIERTKKRCEAVLEAKIMRTVQREQRAAALLKEHESQRQALQKEIAEMEAMKQAQRDQVYHEALAQRKARVRELTEKIEASEKHMRKMAEEQAERARIKAEQDRENEMDKLDCVERRRRADQHRRDELEAKIREKARRVELMKAQQSEISKRNRRLREEVERTRVRMDDPSPGPLDYDTVPKVKDGPKWHFGLPTSALAARQISKSQPAPGYDPSPGPCMYVPRIKPKTPAFSLYRSERWHRTADTSITPGPQDYSPYESFGGSPLSSSRQSGGSPHRSDS